MLGQPVSMLIPRVVGFKLTGQLPEGATATDLVLTITEMLRRHGVVGKFVEFYGDGVGAVPLANRATIGNMSPEYGSTCAIFPIDDETLRYLRFTGRAGEQVALVEAYAKRAGPVARPVASSRSTASTSSSTCQRSCRRSPARSGRRTGSRCPTPRRASAPRSPSSSTAARCVPGRRRPSTRPSRSRSRPATHLPVGATARRDAARVRLRRGGADGRPSRPTRVTIDDGHVCEVDHGAVVIAAITSCTNTSNPSVMVGAALLAKNAVERGLSASRGSRRPSRPARRSSWTTTSAPDSCRTWTSSASTSSATAARPASATRARCRSRCRRPSTRTTSRSSSVLSGNRNFEGRINPDVKMNYLASPPLVVAYAIAGSMDVDLVTRPAGDRPGRRAGLPARRLAQRRRDPGGHRRVGRRGDVQPRLRRRLRRRRALADPADADRRGVRLGRRLHLRAPAAVLRGDAARAGARVRRRGCPGAGDARRLGDHRPHQPGRLHQGRQPGRPLPDRARRGPQGLQLLRLPPRQPRGDDPRHLRQHPAAQPARARRRGRLHRRPPRPAARRPSPSTTRRRPTPRRASRSSSWPARSTAPAPRATGRRRARRCSACAP